MTRLLKFSWIDANHTRRHLLTFVSDVSVFRNLDIFWCFQNILMILVFLNSFIWKWNIFLAGDYCFQCGVLYLEMADSGCYYRLLYCIALDKLVTIIWVKIALSVIFIAHCCYNGISTLRHWYLTVLILKIKFNWFYVFTICVLYDNDIISEREFKF